MKKTGFYCFALACVFTLASVSYVRASGFALYEWSTRGNGMGGALIALADEPSAVAYNPAGMTQLEGTQTQAGMTFIAPSAKAEIGGETYDTVNKVYAPPHAYITHQVNDDLWLGFGVYTRFGVGTNYDDDWAGRYNMYKASLESFTFSPAVAYKLTDDWSVGAALDVMHLSFDLRQVLSPLSGAPNSRFLLENSGIAVGWNVSTRYEITDSISFGAIYRAPQRLVGHGSSEIESSGLDEELKMRATVPGSASVGFSFEPTDWWRFEADAVYTTWSDYKKIEYNFSDATAAVTGLPENLNSLKKWKDTWRFQLGTEFDLNESSSLRFGYVWDESPIRKGYEDYMLPTNDRHMFSCGYGFQKDNWELDLSFMYLMMKDRHIDGRAGTGVSDTDISDSHGLLGGVSFKYAF